MEEEEVASLRSELNERNAQQGFVQEHVASYEAMNRSLRDQIAELEQKNAALASRPPSSFATLLHPELKAQEQPLSPTQRFRCAEAPPVPAASDGQFAVTPTASNRFASPKPTTKRNQEEVEAPSDAMNDDNSLEIAKSPGKERGVATKLSLNLHPPLLRVIRIFCIRITTIQMKRIFAGSSTTATILLKEWKTLLLSSTNWKM